ncbi:hypothetical protein [Streptomyces sp. NRRL F-2664]|uniref:hypothetical protein n=1 Tax=Streptomyces sp. NRRL F-2664 TaxID=1463842 RepID=UPI0004CBCB39|nr:hypothetical protein [Streptomyces sp. NRRL F-2664]
MALSRIAREHAAEIKNHDWSDAPWRTDRAGHHHDVDSKHKMSERVLDEDETRRVRTNVMWVTAQVLAYQDPNFDVYEFAEACGVDTRTRSGRVNGSIAAGLRSDGAGQFARPGTYDFDETP